MDKLELGRRITEARDDAGMTQDGLGRAVGLDRTAITRLEKGERKLSVPELVEIANALGRPLSFFVNAPVPAVISRRRDSTSAHDTNRLLDAELGQFAADIRMLLSMNLLQPVGRNAKAKVPRTHQSAERMAEGVRKRLRMGHEPVSDLGETCQRLGLFALSASLGEGGPDGGCVEVSDASETLGAAVINGDTASGRRRMTLAHELGHWLCGDAYDAEASSESEQMINSLAIHFLAPRVGIQKVWAKYAGWPTRSRALAVGAEFKLSWSAALGQLTNINLITYEEFKALSNDEPRRGEYIQLGLSWIDELRSPYISPDFATACMTGYASGRLTSSRTVELLRGTIGEDDLPRQEIPSLDDLRMSFAGHDG